jgi:hypothetical protein
MLESKRVPEKIIDILNEKGPSLPIHLATKIGISSLFISAYLSELAGEKRIKVSHLRVGGSPLYFLEGQEEQLEKFHTFMHPREIEAFSLLKENKILKDSEQEPAMRVALRSIRDFSIGFKKNDEIYWRYFSVSEREIEDILPRIQQTPRKLEIKKQTYMQTKPAPQPKSAPQLKPVSKPQEIPEPRRIKTQELEVKEVQEKEKEIKKKQTSETFLEEVKFYLKQKNIELVNLESYDKKELIAKIRFSLTPEKIHLLFAYNKKKINDKELLKAYKKSVQHQLDYSILFKGELSKKLKEIIRAHKKLISSDKL